jgi:Leucine-rich repeat (LRR) protein
MKAKRNSNIKGILLLLLLQAGLQAQAQTNVVPDDVEFQALKALYDNAGGANWTNKTNWPAAGSWPATATAAQMGTWYGVTVSNGDINLLLLSNNNLIGTIPPALSQLSQLVRLQLNGNSGLTGSIPSSLGSLSKLQYLYLYSTQLSGSIPAELGNLSSMINLNLQANQLTGSIPSSLGSLTNLTTLSLNNNLLSGPIPAELGNLSALTALSLHYNQLSGSIPSSLGQLTNLTGLQMHSNQLTGTIPSSLGNLTKLTLLYLYGNQLSGAIPSSFGNLTNLTSLQLYSNQLSGSIPSSIGNLNKLQVLHLYSNQLTGTLPPELGNLTALQIINLSSNKLTGSIPASLTQLTNLNTLNFSSNQLSGSIPNGIGSLTNLTMLYLQVNKLSGTIPTSLGALTNLLFLSLNGNQLSGSLPSLPTLTSLIQFQVQNNQLSGTFPSLAGWGNVTYIDASSNQFTGALPSFATCPKLTTFSVNFNQFISLPNDVLNLTLLANLGVNGNALTSIPNFATHVNKGNLTLNLTSNYLDYSQLEPLIGAGIKSVIYSPQNNIRDYPTQSLTVGSDFVLTARPKGAATSNIKWEKLGTDGVTWTDISTSNANSLTGNTYRIATAPITAEGKYRWSCTSTVINGFTLSSDPIEVKTSMRFTLDNLGYQYKYDGRKRMVAKKLPGADWVYMVYDQRDRLVLTQDGNQRALNQWMFTKYDVLNRPVMTGIYTHNAKLDQTAMSGLISTTSFAETFSTTSNHGYTTNIFPNTNLDIRTVTYYDNYNYLSMWGSDNAYNYAPSEVQPVTVNGVTYTQPANPNTQVTGKVTGTKVRTSPNDPYWLQTATYYDDKYRVIQTVSDNIKGGMDVATNLYDFPGKVLTTKTTHDVNALTWQNVVGVKIEGNNLIKTAATNVWGNAGASSVQRIPPGTDGWIERSVTTIASNTSCQFGLSDQDVDQNYTSIDYALSTNGANLYVYIGGAQILTLNGVLAIGDRLRVAREGGNINFYRNGLKVYPPAGTTFPSYSVLMADAAIYVAGVSIGHARMGQVRSMQRTITRKLEYDHAQRLTKVWHIVNWSAPVLLLQNEYNEIGQLVDKKLHSTDGTSFKQSVDYRYNIRGWLSSVNNSQLTANSVNDDSDSDRDLFGMDLAYEKTITGINNTPLYNGNIGAIKWSNNLALGTTKDVAYKYTYDTLNRLQSASYLTNPGTWTTSTNFAERGFKYDLNGNILALQRTDANGATMDQLKYTYDPVRGGNQLEAVSDDGTTGGFADGSKLGDDYTYDANGNMMTDKNKSIVSITYNEMNLPLQVGKSNSESIRYIYDATGRKVSQLVYNASGTLTKKTDYVGEFIYQNDTLQFINHEEGRVVMNLPALQSVGGTTEYQYHLKDHLGNVRMTFTAQPTTDQPVATFEAVNAVAEQGKFLRMDAARLVNSRMFDHTYTGQTPPGDGSAYSERLSGSVNEKTGIARSISVMPGDIIRMEVFVKYVDPTNTNNTTSLTQLLGQIANNSAGAGVVIDGANYLTNGSSLFPYTGLAGEGSGTGLGPKAYLNYIMFDRNYVPVLNDVSQTNFVRVSIAAKEDGTNLPYGNKHEQLYAEVVVKQPGYMYIYLSNEETTPVDVFFDDFKVTQVKSPVVQMEDFYPFGLKFNSYARENAEPNTLKLFQGQEHVDDLGLNWDAFKWRNHQPDIGRFFNVDPLSEKYVYNSTYAFSENQVVAHRELEGLEKWDIKYSDGSDERLYGPFKNQQAAEQHADNQIMISPVQNPLVNSGLGAREAPVEGASTNHKGSDIVRSDNRSETNGTPVVADQNGKVTEIKSKDDGNNAGNRVSIVSADGRQHNFFHLQDGAGKGLTVGQNISRGTKIGNVGSSGNVSGPHLHYEIRKTPWGTPLNPVKVNPGLANGTSKTIVPAKSSPYKLQGQISIQ